MRTSATTFMPVSVKRFSAVVQGQALFPSLDAISGRCSTGTGPVAEARHDPGWASVSIPTLRFADEDIGNQLQLTEGQYECFSSGV
jgi:hypothetical protein